jgi:phosphate:Na+ symporter
MPSFAVDALHKEVIRMMDIVNQNMNALYLMMNNSSTRVTQQINLRESAINSINKEVQAFAPLVISKTLSNEQSREVNLMVNVSSQLERIGDIVKGISELEIEKIRDGIVFSELAIIDLTKMMDTVKNAFDIVKNNFETLTIEQFNEIEKIEQSVDEMEVCLRNAHVERLMTGICSPEAGIIYVDILSDFERVSDHIYKVARLLKEKAELEVSND